MAKIFHYALAAGLCTFSAAYAASNTAPDNLTPGQTKQIETIIHDYLMSNPKVIVEAAQGLQKQETQKYVDDIKIQIPKHIKELFDTKAPGREIIGNNNKPDVVIVEFFSYQCPICHMMAPVVDSLVKSQKNVQVILIGWPFEGKDDVYAAKVALAAQKQGKYLAIYKALMDKQEILTQDSIDKAAQSVGLNMDKLHTDINDSTAEKWLQNNFKLARDLKLMGTPAFIITNSTFNKFNVIFGRATEEALQQAITEVH